MISLFGAAIINALPFEEMLGLCSELIPSPSLRTRRADRLLPQAELQICGPV